MAAVMDYSERLMRATLMDLPDGEGDFEDFCDGDGIADDPVRQGCAVLDPPLGQEDAATALIVDFAGTDPQVKGPMNAPLSVTASGVFCGLKTAIDPEQPHSAQFRLLAHHRGHGAQGLGGERRIPRAGRLRQPRDVAPRRRHGDGRAGHFMAEPGDGLQPGHVGDPDARAAPIRAAAGTTCPTRPSRAGSAHARTRTASTSSPAASPTP